MSDETGERMTTESRRNVKVVEQVYEAFAKRDLPAIFGLFTPDIEISQSNEVPWGGIYHGHEGAQRFFSKLTQAINSTVSLERFIDAGEQVVAVGRTRGSVNHTGERYDVPIAHVWTVSNERVSRVRFYIDNPSMLEAL
jgi:ketosteroid isomerase-like protein